MRIGELSKRSGATIQTLRFYERQKLLRPPPRTNSGYRVYSDADLERVRFIRDAQALGFTLRDIRELTRIHEPKGSHGHGHAHWPQAFEIARRRLSQIEQKIRELQAFRKRLSDGLERSSRKAFRACPASEQTDSRPSPASPKCPAQS